MYSSVYVLVVQWIEIRHAGVQEIVQFTSVSTYQ